MNTGRSPASGSLAEFGTVNDCQRLAKKPVHTEVSSSSATPPPGARKSLDNSFWLQCLEGVPICVLESRYRKLKEVRVLIGLPRLRRPFALRRSAVRAARKSAIISVSMVKSSRSAKQRGLRCVNSRCRTRWLCPKALHRRSTVLQNALLSTWRGDSSVSLNRGAMPGSACGGMADRRSLRLQETSRC